MIYVRSNKLSFKYQRFTPSAYKDIGIRKLNFLATTQFHFNKEPFDRKRGYFYIL